MGTVSSKLSNIKTNTPNTKFFKGLENIPADIWKSGISFFLSPKDQNSLKQTSKAVYQATDDYRSLLRIHFPDDYDKLKNSGTTSALNFPNRENEYGRITHNRDRHLSTCFKHAFRLAYTRDYAVLDSRSKKLMTLFKAGCLEEIKTSHLTLDELSSIHDQKHKYLLERTSTNRQKILNYCYDHVVIPFYQNSAYSLDIHKQGSKNKTILHWAIECRQPLETITLLLHSGADCNAALNNGANSLILAAEFGLLDIAKHLTTLPDINLNAALKTGITALHFAVYNNHLDLITHLTSLPQINLNATSKNGTTPLMIAADIGNFDIVKHLTSLPALDLNAARTIDGATALHFAAQSSHLDIILHLTSLPALNSNAARTIDGATALHFAAESGHLDIIIHLTALRNIDLNAACTNGKTALLIAVQKGHLCVIKHLTSLHNIDLNKTDRNNATALFIAVLKDRIDIVRHLTSLSDIDINAISIDGATALFIAAQNGHLNIVKHLAALPSIRLNATPRDGLTALSMAAQEGHHEIVRHLASYPAIIADYFMKKNMQLSYHAEEMIKDGVENWIGAVENTNNPLYPVVHYLFAKHPDSWIFIKKGTLFFSYILCANMLIEQGSNKSPAEILQYSVFLSFYSNLEFFRSLDTTFLQALQEAKEKLSDELDSPNRIKRAI